MFAFDRSATVSLVAGATVLAILMLRGEWHSAGVFFVGFSIGGFRISL